MTPSPSVVTRLLDGARSGDRPVLDELIPILYEELRLLAKRHMHRQNPGHSLQSSDLVNEAYLKLANVGSAEWQGRAQFVAFASRAMRSVLVDHARRRAYAKRGGNPIRVSLNQVILVSEQKGTEIIAVDKVLRRLARIDVRKSQIVELRYFGGLSVEETAEVLGVSPITVKREWLKAKAWLYKELQAE